MKREIIRTQCGRFIVKSTPTPAIVRHTVKRRRKKTLGFLKFPNE